MRAQAHHGAWTGGRELKPGSPRCNGSGIVLNYEHGQDIDKHDMVFRFNSAPTKGYEKHVGSKTTHRITNTQNWGFHESREENILIHFRAKSAIKVSCAVQPLVAACQPLGCRLLHPSDSLSFLCC